MMRRQTWPVLALAALLTGAAGAAGCGGGGGVETNGQSVVVVHLNIENGAPALYQIEVDAHLGNGGDNNTLFFPTSAQDHPIASGDTLALLIRPSIMDMLDLVLYGLDGQGHRVANGNGQANIAPGARVDTTISLSACAAPGC